MGLFNQDEFDELIISNGFIGIKAELFTLKSGRKSHFYVNWRNATNDVYLINQLADHIIKFTKDKGIEPDTFYGVPEGATKIGLITQYAYSINKVDCAKGNYTLAMGRGAPKGHGDPKDCYFIGMPKGKTIIIEDVTTTGESLLETIDQLLEAGVEVIGAIGLTNRNEKRDDGSSVEHAVKEKGVNYYAMSNALDLLPKVIKKENTSPELVAKLEEYYTNYGVCELVV